MNRQIDISFCIPTYNFARFLPETLDSILSQADHRIEIIIVDGGSTDETDVIVAAYQKRFDRIVYFKRDKNCGVDQDILKSTELASGQYCWLFSADDVLKPGAIAKIRELIQVQQWNVLVANFMICDFHLGPKAKHNIFRLHSDFSADWSLPEQRRKYFDAALTSTAFFSYISSVVVKRRDWLDTESCEEFLGSCWIIAAKVMKMSRRHLCVYYYDEELFWKRGDNDSFLSRGIPWRIELALSGFPNVAKSIFGEYGYEYEAFRRVTKNELSFINILGFKAQLPDVKEENEAFEKTVRKYWMRGRNDALCCAVMSFLPVFILKRLRKLAKKYAPIYKLLKHLGRSTWK